MAATDDRWSARTRAIATGRPVDPGAPLNVPIVPASAFREGGDHEYARAGNPTWEALESVVSALEGGSALAFGSGMAAMSAALSVACARHQVPVVAAPGVHYLGTRALLNSWADQGRIQLHEYDGESDEALHVAAGADVLVIETPSNPMMAITDIAAMAATCNGVTIADNTFATPMGTRPLELGVDIVVHSATKYLAGHSDALLGAVASNDESLVAALFEHRLLHGATPGVLESWLTTRGLRTLPLRISAASANAQEIAERLAGDPRVAWVRYPGLPQDRGHEVAVRQMDTFGAMVSFGAAGGSSHAEQICHRVELWTAATSLGGVESTFERRARIPAEAEVVPGELIRLSVGCEDPADLWADLDAALG